MFTAGIIAKVLPEKSAPEWMLLFAAGWGEVEKSGRFLVDEEAFGLISTEMARRGNDLVVDYEHATITGQEAPAAGWVRELKWDPGQGVLARIDWTEKAAGYLAAGEYKYHSPVFFVRKSDQRVVSVHSVALTNAPKTNNLKAITAKMGLDGEEESEMDLKVLTQKLGLPETADEAAVLAAIDALRQGPKEVIAKAVLTALEMESGDESAVVASIHALKQQPRGMVSKAEFDALKAEMSRRDAEEVVAKAMADGKITPDQKEWAMAYAASDKPGFETFVAKAPVVIPVDSLPGGARKAEKAVHDEAVLKVAKLMGVSEADIKQYGGLE